MRSDKPTNDAVAEFQHRTREALRAQQEAYLTAVKAWREGMSKAPQPPWPQPKVEGGPAPTPSELAEAYYAFTAKLLADQTRFMEELSKAMAGADKKTDKK
jgi:hypothetical protein